MRALAVAALATLAIGTGCSTAVGESVPSEMADRYPSTTASEWVTYADFVAVVTIPEDRRAVPAQEALKRGEGAVDRAVRFAVEEVVWRKEGSRQPPASIVYPALGWEFRGGDVENAAEVVPDDRPRFEPGNRYVVAFAWEPERCYEGDGVIPPRWVGLGSGSALPFDGDVIGAGEFAGEERGIVAAEEYAEQLPTDSVAALVTGEPLDRLRALLAEAEPEPKGDYGPAPSDC